MTIYREAEYEALLYGIRSARSLANRCRLTAQLYPQYEREDMAESKRHFARARDYLQLAKARRAQ